MSLHFSANQYEQAFDPKILQNWQVPSIYRQRPRTLDGFTQIVASDRGHLLPGVKRSRKSPWGDYIGTYDMPLKIPGNSMMNKTARTFHAQMRLERCKTDGDIVLEGKLKRPHVPDPLPVKADVRADEGISNIPPAPIDNIGPAPIETAVFGNGRRSGAKTPEPPRTLSRSPKLAPISPKPGTPAKTPINWPMRAKSGSPKVMSPTAQAATTNAAVAGSPEPELQAIGQDINWPSPKVVDQAKVAA